MPNTSHNLLNYLHVAVGAWRDDPRDDAALLVRFAETGDEATFRALVWRHGALVWQTCQRVLGDTPDAEDVFQTTFLALARKASQLRREPLAGWLHRVARRAALDAQAAARRRRGLEQQLRAVKQPEAEEDTSRAELYAALDEELAGLPERLRVPLLLYYLEGKSQVEVARLLGCARSVVQYRLARGEAALRKRLERRGLAVSVGSIAVLLGSTAGTPAVPAGLISSTARAALRSLSFSQKSSTSATLAEGVIKTMLMSNKLKIVAVLLGLTLCLGGGGMLAYQALAGNTVEPSQFADEPRGEVQAPRQPEAAARLDCYGDPLPSGVLARMGTTRLWNSQKNTSWSSSALAFSPDGKTLAAQGSDDRTVCLWDAATGKEICRLTDAGKLVALSPDGQTLLTEMSDKRNIRLWEAATGKLLRKVTYPGPKNKRPTAPVTDPKQLKRWTADLDNSNSKMRDKAQQEIKKLGEAAIPALKQALEEKPSAEVRRRLNDLLAELDIAPPPPSFLGATFLPNGKILAGRWVFKWSKFYRGPKNQREAVWAWDARGVCLWDVATGKEISQIKGRIPAFLPPDRFNSSPTFSPDGKMLAAFVDQGEGDLRLWDIATGKEIRKLTFNFNPGGLRGGDSGFTLAFSRDGKMLASGGEESIWVWDVATGKQIHRFVTGKFAYTIVFSPDGKTLVGGEKGHCWDIATGNILRSFDWAKLDTHDIRLAAFSPDGKILATREPKGVIRLWEVATGKEISLRKGHQGAVYSIAYSPDGKTLVSGSADKTVRLWEVVTGKEIRQLPEHEGWAVYSVAYSPDGKLLASTNAGGCYLWEAATGKKVHEFKNDLQGLDVFSFSPNGKLLATDMLRIGGGAGMKNTPVVNLWDVATGKKIRSLPTGNNVVAFSPDSRMLATPGNVIDIRDKKTGKVDMHGTIGLWEVATGKSIGQLHLEVDNERGESGNTVKSFAFSPDGRILAVARWMGDTASLWDVASGKKIHQLKGLEGGAEGRWSFSFSPDGRMVAAPGGKDRKVHLWEVATGKEIGQLSGHRSTVRTVAFSPDGKTLASGSDDTTCLIWDVTSFASRLKPVLARSLPSQMLSKEQLEAAWTDLAATDSAKAYRALWNLTQAPPQAIALLRERVRPAAPVTDLKQLQRWIADLDNSDFKMRDKAQQEIEKLGEAAIPALKQALKEKPSAEVRRRLNDLLAELTPKMTDGSPRPSRELRAVQVMEYIGTAEARQLLQAWAEGVAGASLTVEAEAARARLARRSPAGS